MNGSSSNLPVPNPMANIPPSPDGSRPPSTTLSLTLSPPPSVGMSSPLYYNADDDGGDNEIDQAAANKRIKSSSTSPNDEISSSGNIRWNVNHGHGNQHTRYDPPSVHQTGIMASKPSETSLTSSHPSHASFASTQTESTTVTSPNVTPDPMLFYQRGGNTTAANATSVSNTNAMHGISSVNTTATNNGSVGQMNNIMTSSIFTNPKTNNNNINSTNNNSRRIKRLERNRESARQSRKRRKAYLEDLEHKVHSLSGGLDMERVDVALKFLEEVLMTYDTVVVGNDGEGGVGGASGDAVMSESNKPRGIQHPLQHTMPKHNHNNTTTTTAIHDATKIPSALQIIYTFQHAYLSSLILPREYKFILWVLIQRERFWRGGRGNSDRLSAARIGERMLHNGTYNATPNTGMWPLLCHEIGLSYEQEDKVRTTQRAILAQSNSWISRHTAASTVNVLNEVHSSLTQFHNVGSERERGIKHILTEEQRGKFLKWTRQKSNAILMVVQSKLESFDEEHEYTLDPQRHVAANLYIVNHRLSKINSRLLDSMTTITAPVVHPSKLKKLSRRPCFESLAVQDAAAAENNKSSSKLRREASFPSTGSLKRTLNELSGDTNSNDAHHLPTPNTTGITVESAHAAAQPGVRAIFQDIMDIIPPSYVYQMQLEHFKAVPASSSVVSASEAMYGNLQMASTQQQQESQYAMTTSTFHQPQAPVSSDEMDIPMPTPVSVLLQTQDEFLDVEITSSSGVPIEVTSAMQQPPVIESGFIPSIEYAPPEPVPSTPNNTHGLLPTRSYASAPNLFRNDFDMPTTNLMPVPEEGLHKSGEDVFDLEELGDPNDWAIGESFDLDMK